MKYVVLAVLLLFSLSSQSAPVAESPNECEGIADMAVTARALAIEGLTAEQSGRIMLHMYKPSFWQKWMSEIVAKAQRDERPAAKFANDLGALCVRTQGKVDSFFGTAV